MSQPAEGSGATMHLGVFVRVARAAKDLTQTQLAQRTGLSQSRICLIEKERCQPTLTEWAKIWGALTTE